MPTYVLTYSHVKTHAARTAYFILFYFVLDAQTAYITIFALKNVSSVFLTHDRVMSRPIRHDRGSKLELLPIPAGMGMAIGG